MVRRKDGKPTGGGWTRTGTPPNLTIVPSIQFDAFHGHLRHGVIEDDVDGRKFDMLGIPVKDAIPVT